MSDNSEKTQFLEDAKYAILLVDISGEKVISSFLYIENPTYLDYVTAYKAGRERYPDVEFITVPAPEGMLEHIKQISAKEPETEFIVPEDQIPKGMLN